MMVPWLDGCIANVWAFVLEGGRLGWWMDVDLKLLDGTAQSRGDGWNSDGTDTG